MNLESVLEQEILAKVERPSRYLGNEVNATHKDPAGLDVRLVLAFPDLYDLGLGNLGIHILYTVINALPWASCERAYSPGLDLERELRARNLPLFALESKDSLDQFDGLGITLQSELTWTNILNLLDLGGMPVRSRDRTDAHPIVFAGGPAVFNPEPLAPFIDLFIMGDGEDAIVEIAEVLRAYKGRTRREKLTALAAIEGAYVPELYPMETLPDGRVLPAEGAPKIRKRITRDLDGATFPVDYIVPFTPQVHDRVSLEVLRGCTQGCRFCQAGMVTRPVRERSLERVDELLQRTLDATGYEEVSLVSLSTCDHSRVRQLVENTVEVARARNVAVGLPSLRLDSFSVELADMVAETRRTGLTVAPEAASPRLRALINKWIPDEDLLGMADKAFSLSWNHVKLYFMIGLPTERDDDILAIADLARRTLDVGRKHNGRAKVNLGVSTFVPKPFTPFQWAAQIPPEETARRQHVLQRALPRGNAIKFGHHEPEETYLEGLLSRSDRRAGDLIEAAWRLGARFDAWRELMRFDLWVQAIEETGFDVADALRERDVEERLPWDHIDVLIPKSWFAADWKRALELQHAEDCRHKRCHKCGVIDAERELCAAMLRENVEGRKLERAWERKPSPARPAPVRAQRIWLRVARTGKGRFLSHLEGQTAWMRSLRRANIPLSYSVGFHPRPTMAFSNAMPLGEESVGDYLDIELSETVDAASLPKRINATLPEGFEVIDAQVVPLKSPSLMGLVAGGIYKIQLFGADAEEVQEAIDDLLGAETVLSSRRTKAGGRRGRRTLADVDIRPMIHALRMEPNTAVPTLHVELGGVDCKPGKPGEVVERMPCDPARARVVRVETLVRQHGELVPLSELALRLAAAPSASTTAELAANL